MTSQCRLWGISGPSTSYQDSVRFRPKADIAHHKFHRLDESAPRHGIGLAVVGDIARSYGGNLTIQVSDLGGAEIKVTIPPAPGP